MANEQEYSVWTSMKARCSNANDKDYARYGGRGISVCKRWQESFENFMKDMGPRKDGETIERKNNNGNYEPSNCVWVDRKTQAGNRNHAKTHSLNAEVFSVGTWNGDKYTDQDLEDMVRNFKELKDIVKPFVKLGHNEKQMKDGNPALGWITGLKKVGKKLIATISDVPDILYNAIKTGRYKRVSSEIYWNLKQGGKTFKRVLGAIALLGADIPAVNNLADLEAYLTQSSESSFDMVKLYSFETDEDGTLKTTTTVKENKMDDQTAKTLEEMSKKLLTIESNLELKSVELNTYKSLVDELKANHSEKENEVVKLKQQLKDAEKREYEKAVTERSTEMEAWAEVMVKEFKMLPAGRDLLLKEGARLYTKDEGYSVPFTTFKAYVEMQAKVLDPKEVTLTDKAKDKTYTDISSKVDAMAREYAAEHKIEYGTALTAIFEKHPDLSGDYINSGITDKDAE